MARATSGKQHVDFRLKERTSFDSHIPHGIVNLSGDFLKEHKDEILHLIRNEEKLAEERNPAEKIISLKDEGNKLHIETTLDNFAIRIGKAIQHAYKGKKEIKFRRGDKFAMVNWKRD